MAEHIQLGNTGEQWACEFLIRKGYTVLARNYRYKRAEIDIIARKDRLIIFVEVKTRRSNAYGEPETFVSQSKIDLLLMAAGHYVEQTDWMHDIRFDIISVHLQDKVSIVHLEDAFY
jgi:putative endonuclease